MAKIKSGWFACYRTDVQNLSWDECHLLWLFTSRARYNGNQYCSELKRNLQPGEFFFGIREIAKSARVSPKTPEAWVQKLVQWGTIRLVHRSRKGSIGIIIDKNRFLFNASMRSDPLSDPLSDQEPTNKEQVTNNKNTNIHTPPFVEDPDPVQAKGTTGSTQCVEVIGYLNMRANTHFRANCKSSSKFINARLKDGHTVEDLKAVIDTKVHDWQVGDPYRKFLRPETLFNETKFASYLNESKLEKPVDAEQDFADFMREHCGDNNA